MIDISEQKNKNLFTCLSLFLIFLAFFYTAYRARVLSMTHDEALTYLVHVKGTFRQIMTYQFGFQINNHLLHTFLVKSLISLLGNSEFVIRIPALLGHGFYLAGVYLILKKTAKGFTFPIGILLSISNPYMLDYFSAARGYSLGLGFSILGLYVIIKQNSDLFYSSLFIPYPVILGEHKRGFQ